MLARLQEVLTPPAYRGGSAIALMRDAGIQVRGLGRAGSRRARSEPPTPPAVPAGLNPFEIDPAYWSSPERERHIARAAEINLDIPTFDTPDDAIAAAARCEARLREEMEAEVSGEPPCATLPLGPFAKPCPPKLVSVGRGPLPPEIAAPRVLSFLRHH